MRRTILQSTPDNNAKKMREIANQQNLAKSEKEKIGSEIIKQNEELGSLQNSILNLQKEKEALEGKVRGEKINLILFSDRTKKAETELSALQIKKQSFLGALEEEIKKIDSSKNLKQKELEKTLADIRAEIESSIKNHKEVFDEIVEMQKAEEELSSFMRARQEELKFISKELHAKNQELKDCAKKIAVLENKHSNLENACADVNKKIALKEELLNSFVKNIKDYEIKIRSLNSEKLKIEKEIDEKGEYIANLGRRENSLRIEGDKLRKIAKKLGVNLVV